MEDDRPLDADGRFPATSQLDYEHLIAAGEQVLEDVDRALVRLEHGTYDTCEICGGSIGEERLAEHPTTRRCDHHELDEKA